MSSLESFLLLLKYGGAFGAAAYGIYATVTDLHTESGGRKVLSKKGRYGIVVLVISSLSSILSGIGMDRLERHAAAKEKDEQAKRYENTIQEDAAIIRELNQINQNNEAIIRNLKEVNNEVVKTGQPIKDVRVAFCLQLPMQHPKLQTYRQRLENEVPRLIREGRLVVSYPMTDHGPVQEVLFEA